MTRRVRDANLGDWPAIWSIVHEVVVAAVTFPYDPEMTEDEGRALWMVASPGRTTVAVDGAEVVGTANMYANRAGPGAHVEAVALYRSLEFTIVGTVPEAFEHPEHGVVGLHVMHLKLQ